MGSIYDELEGANRLKVIKITDLTNGTVNTFVWDYREDNTYEYIWATPTETITNNYSNSITSGSSLMILFNSGIWWSDITKTGYDNSRPYYWEGKMALMYPSDYGSSAVTTCVNGTSTSSYQITKG